MSIGNPKPLHYKLFSLFSVVRGYNILMIVIAQYLAAIFILGKDYSIREVLLNFHLFLIILASSLAIAAGYIINSFYDTEKDYINRPQKTMLDNYISQKTKLSVYFILNILTIVIASYVSFRAVVFFSLYIFGLWFYSHKLKKLPFVGNITASILAITPFFAVFIYYHNFDLVIFIHATYLFLLLTIREIVKDLENLRGDFAQNYQTIPVVYGIRFTKKIISLLVLFTTIPTLILMTNNFNLGYMNWYFLLSFVLLVTFLILIWQAGTKAQYNKMHNFLKFIIVAGVFSILLIEIDMVINRFL
ncbi:geranylgeranylglycerol-phosphate geranylgeranyltransferase [Mesonia sp. K7]|uniref:geranylgeranylglycerol-phosphate geranylgeranyltransferase n=1 Tax=Mesonia sp. K7 TaxID=2218606 RepID=UPI000DA99E33|nr:geranylgeranylglycerol-phosphate geranylgeranyltransferase [Mesonia sp. K7]PZD79613.1 ubiquinone biosynthesis protein UbiA [Mesonia sp. K7]